GFNSPEWVDTCPAAGSGTIVHYPHDFDLSFTWTGVDSCPYKPSGDSCGASAGTKDPHQCVLVDLKVASGSTKHYSFASESVFRNMDFDVNSTLVRYATIDIKGLGPMPAGATNRDVYLYVHTRNLPDKIENEAPADKGNDHRETFLSARRRFKELQLPATG